MKNIYDEKKIVKREERERLLKGKGLIIWLTGISGSGKSTIGKYLEKKLNEEGYLTNFLDGDNLRLSINSDLSFSKEDRKENIRRAKEICKILLETGVIVIAAFISPNKEVREKMKLEFKNDFIEVYIKCDLETCEKRDVKGLYKKTKNLEIKDFTGIDSEYEEPDNPNVLINTNELSREESVSKLWEFLKGEGYV